MDATTLPFGSPLEAYDARAAALLAAWRARDAAAIDYFRRRHPRFLREDVPWLSRSVSDDEIASAPLDADDARLALARAHDFIDWPALARHLDDLRDPTSDVARFEAAVEAVVAGDVASLRAALVRDRTLVHARSTRACPFDPPVHRSTLLHYVAANGVEQQRQRTPPTAVAIARVLLEAGADADALADLYGGQCTTMALLVSSSHPAAAGLQVPLVHLLVDFGAAVQPRGRGAWTSPLMTALTFGFVDAAAALVDRGAPVDTLAAAAGLGRDDEVARRLPSAPAEDRHRAMALAAQLGRLEALRVLLDAGEDPSRYNPPAAHAHATPLHQAVDAGHLDVVRLLVERGARLDLRDRIYDGTPLGWADHLGRPAIAAYLRDHTPPRA